MYEKIRKFDADILRKIKVSEKIANSLLKKCKFFRKIVLTFFESYNIIVLALRMK